MILMERCRLICSSVQPSRLLDKGRRSNLSRTNTALHANSDTAPSQNPLHSSNANTHHKQHHRANPPSLLTCNSTHQPSDPQTARHRLDRLTSTTQRHIT